jgi:hypothetical protein
MKKSFHKNGFMGGSPNKYSIMTIVRAGAACRDVAGECPAGG